MLADFPKRGNCIARVDGSKFILDVWNTDMFCRNDIMHCHFFAFDLLLGKNILYWKIYINFLDSSQMNSLRMINMASLLGI